MHSGFLHEKREILRRGFPIFHIILPVLSGQLLFRDLVRYSAPHWYTHQEVPEFHRFLCLFFPVLQFWLLFFSARFPVFVCEPVPPFAAARTACCQSFLFLMPVFLWERTGQERIFRSVPLIFQDNNHNRRYNLQ